MPVVSEFVHPRGLDFHNQRQVVVLRDARGMTWSQIASRVRNVQGGRPSVQMVANVYYGFQASQRRRVSRYSRCGRKPWKITPQVEKFLVKRLLQLRKTCVCTSTTLQRELLRDENVRLSDSAIRKVLTRKGYKWLPRAQKPKLTAALKRQRLAFAQQVLAMTQQQLKAHLGIAMDGVILSLPPTEAVDRQNYCRHGDSHMWRTEQESASPELAGESMYADQVPLKRAVPMWAGVGFRGCAVIAFHPRKKLKSAEWAHLVEQGKLVDACKKLHPARVRGPWHVLCDNETFLKAPLSEAAHRRARVELWHIPAKSPDLNPAEKFWSWLRRRLRAMDLADLSARRAPVQKFTLKTRVRNLLQTQQAKRVAGNCASGLRRVCQEVIRLHGAATRG